MSRDQRPRREVMVDTVPDRPEAVRNAPIVDAGLPPPVPQRRLLWSIVFLLACAVGAPAVALLVPDTIW